MQMQQMCSDWGAYWRAPDAHGVDLSHEQALELLRFALGVEVDIAAPAQPADPLTLSQRTAIEQWLAFGEQMLREGHQSGYYSGSGWAAVQLRSILSAAPAQPAEPVTDEDADVLASYSRKDGRREWVNVGCWLRPGEEIVHRAAAQEKYHG
jgi:hypothetical protein